MPTKRLAKRAVALKVCAILHRLKELDDIHLFPIKRLELDLEKNPTDPQPNQNRNRVYNRRLAACLTNCRPRAGQTSFVYSIDFTLVKPCRDITNLNFPSAVQTKLAILSSKFIPDICAFPLITLAGEVKVNLRAIDSIILDDRQLEKLDKFHQFLFQDVIFLWIRQLNFDPDVSALQYLIVPLHSATEKIDFNLVEKMINAPIIDWNASPCRDEKYDFDATLFVDAVIVPSHKHLGTLNTFYVDRLSDLTPLSPFPDEQYENYASYFAEKHGLPLTNSEQRLIQVSREITRKNFLTLRESSTKKDFIHPSIHLAPELCHIHPLPASIWKQVVWIPSILHRLNGMLVAEELRLLLCKEAKIGIDFLPEAVNVSTVWCPLRKQKKSILSRGFFSISPDQKRLLESCNPSTLLRLLDCDPSLIWNFDYGDAYSPSCVSYSNASGQLFDIEAISETDIPNEMQETTRITPQDACTSTERTDSINEQRRKWIDLASESRENSSTCSPELFNLNFDSPNLNTVSLYGPLPGLILEALTPSKAQDGYGMKRLETLGNSILKLIVSIYVYGETINQRCGEGRLSLMRTRQINNKHLFALGEKKSIGEFIAAQKFDLTANFLPPAFQTPVAKNEPNWHIQQFVSMNNVAGCMEALIGVYLLTTGIKGAITVMNWMGLQTMPKGEVQVRNETNGIPVLAANKELAISHLFAGLDLFEKRLSYTFKNKMLLIESLTHPSHLPNQITGSYQRLEFLGDAVLDYLVTRFFFDKPYQYSPAILTDMRSAMVNNQTFAVMAVKNRFHLYLKHNSLPLSLLMDRFIRAQEDNGHLLMHDYFVLEETSDPNEQMASNINFPKVLGDIFESVAGAIFVDSGMSLDAVWKAYLPFLHDAFVTFNETTPISPIRLLHEHYPSALKFEKSETLLDGRFCVAVKIAGVHEGVHTFKGAGESSKTAKNAAAKYALSVLIAQQ